ncbi:MAG: radical SAM protein, partial [Candidatus Binatia bacterium]|nr:radical SAM protein [Candidatus Binatia bacterium]
MERLSAPLDVQIELTSQCNQECRHCYNYWRHSLVKDQDELGMNDYSMVIDQLRDAKVGLVTFKGGEPMLRKEILLKLIALATSYGIETGLNTNAALIQCKDARALKEQGLKHVLVSVLGPEDI